MGPSASAPPRRSSLCCSTRAPPTSGSHPSTARSWTWPAVSPASSICTLGQKRAFIARGEGFWWKCLTSPFQLTRCCSQTEESQYPGCEFDIFGVFHFEMFSQCVCGWNCKTSHIVRIINKFESRSEELLILIWDSYDKCKIGKHWAQPILAGKSWLCPQWIEEGSFCVIFLLSTKTYKNPSWYWGHIYFSSTFLFLLLLCSVSMLAEKQKCASELLRKKNIGPQKWANFIRIALMTEKLWYILWKFKKKNQLKCRACIISASEQWPNSYVFFSQAQ